MNKEECELCIKYKTIFCPNSSECYMTQDKPYYQNRIMLLEENKRLKDKVKQLEKEREKIKEYVTTDLQNYERLIKTSPTPSLYYIPRGVCISVLNMIERDGSDE